MTDFGTQVIKYWINRGNNGINSSAIIKDTWWGMEADETDEAKSTRPSVHWLHDYLRVIRYAG